MIMINARDPIELWYNLCSGWVSGQEDWIEEKSGSMFFSYNNVMAVRWDYNTVENQGKDLLYNLGYKRKGTKLTQLRNKYVDEKALQKLKKVYQSAVKNEKSRFLYGMNFKMEPERSGGCLTGLQIMKKQNGSFGVHIYIKVCELPKKFAADLQLFNQIFRDLEIPNMTSVAIHSTALFFWRITMPLLLPILGRQAFFNHEVIDLLNKDIGKLDRILHQSYKYKSHQAVWAHVRSIMNKEDL